MAIKKIIDLTLQELTLVVARHEYPDIIWQLDEDTEHLCLYSHIESWGRTDYKYFRIDWQTIGPIWEREADNLWKYFHARGLASINRTMYQISKSPESICRALVEMWYPKGITL